MSRLRQLRVDDPRIGRTRGFLDEAAALQSVEEARDPGRREQHAPREVDPPHHSLGRVGEVQEHLVVVQRQAVLRLEPCAEPSGRGHMRAHEPDKRSLFRRSKEDL